MHQKKHGQVKHIFICCIFFYLYILCHGIKNPSAVKIKKPQQQQEWYIRLIQITTVAHKCINKMIFWQLFNAN